VPESGAGAPLRLRVVPSSGTTPTTKHNYAQGLAAYLVYLEAFHGSCGAGAGKYTSSGVTVGLGRVVALCDPPVIPLTPDLRIDSIPLFLERRCDRTPGDCRRVQALREPVGPGSPGAAKRPPRFPW
jgi:hypothetical protein